MNLSEHPFILSISDDGRRQAIIDEVEELKLDDEAIIFDEDSEPDAYT